MTLPKLKYTKQRGGYYHLNIPIPAAIRKEYGGKVAYERSTGSSDPKEAERQVTAQRAAFDVQVRAAQRRADQARLKALLDPADAGAGRTLLTRPSRISAPHRQTITGSSVLVPVSQGHC